MRNNYSCLEPNKERSVSRDVPGYYDTGIKVIKRNRLCLKCGKRFLSTGSHNRLCKTCISTNKTVVPKLYHVSSEYINKLNQQ